VAAVLSCGVRQQRLKWTAPATWQGAIWLSTGFVATEKVSGDPLGDAVTELTTVIMPAASESARYESTLHGSCAVRGAVRARGAQAPVVLVALAVLALARRRTRGAR
jgi:hypothetical protein